MTSDLAKSFMEALWKYEAVISILWEFRQLNLIKYISLML